MTEAEQASKHGGPSKARIIGARILTIIAVLLALVGMVAFYVEHTVLDEQGFEAISRQMIENDEIRTQVAAKSVDTLFENVDVEAAIAERLPPAQRTSLQFWRVSLARAPIAPPMPCSHGPACRRCGSR